MMLCVHEILRAVPGRKKLPLIIGMLAVAVWGLVMIGPALSAVSMESGDKSMSLDNHDERQESGDSLFGTPPPNPGNSNWDYYEQGLPWGIVPEVHIPWYPPGNRPRPPQWGHRPSGAPFPPGMGGLPPYGPQKPPGGAGSGLHPPQWGHRPPGYHGYHPGEHRPGWRPPHGAQRPHSPAPGWHPSKPQNKPSQHGRPLRPADRPGNPHRGGSGREMTRGQ